ncbi:MAG: lactate racemase domain-containing protein [Clostridiales bacterium]|nr:lactate racemase domain-containing protein [Clostridiales bacterium]
MYYTSERGLTDDSLRQAVAETLSTYAKDAKRILILPPDFTRMYSGAGKITALIVDAIGESAKIDVMPALGTHAPMTREECDAFFLGRVKYEDLIVHNWRTDVVKIGEVPAEFVREVSEGLVDTKIDVEVNRLIVSGDYDCILSVGQVVPHEVVGMANYSKNIFVGCGGSSMINSSHMLGAFYGLERIMGRDFSPVRRVFDYAEEHFLASVPLVYMLTCTTNTGEQTNIHGLYVGRERANFEAAVEHSQRINLIKTDEPFRKVVVYLDPREFKSTWLGNKAVYRTRMAIADGGELIVLAPGVVKFGEDAENDRLIRKYGYVGRENVLKLVADPANADLAANLSVAAHLIHGSSDGRFSITYCTKGLTKEEVEGAAFLYRPYEEAAAEYDPSVLRDGWNEVGGERIYYISNPALGLWSRA